MYATGVVPSILDERMIMTYYRYDSGAREFKAIPDGKSLSLIVDAVSLYPYPMRKL